VASYDDNDKKVDDYDKECVMAIECSVKHQARLSTDHIERLLEEACPNHA
jgi:hypothetical protein